MSFLKLKEKIFEVVQANDGVPVSTIKKELGINYLELGREIVYCLRALEREGLIRRELEPNRIIYFSKGGLSNGRNL